MNKIQKETEQYVVYSPDSLNYLTNEMHNILNNSIKFYKELFGVEQFRKIQINYFDRTKGLSVVPYPSRILIDGRRYVTGLISLVENAALLVTLPRLCAIYT